MHDRYAIKYICRQDVLLEDLNINGTHSHSTGSTTVEYTPAYYQGQYALTRVRPTRLLDTGR